MRVKINKIWSPRYIYIFGATKKYSVMKNFFLIFSLIITLSMFSGCALHKEAASNLNQSQTSVVLQQRNFKVVGTVTGESAQTYLLGFIGGLSRKALRESALSEMYRKADINGKPCAIVNVNVQYKFQYYVLVVKCKALARGDIVEFTE